MNAIRTAAEPTARRGLSVLQAVVLILFCLAAYLPGIASLPPTDRDESRFVQATRQMAETGNYVDIHFQDQTRYKKPIGIYWLQSAAVALSGDGASAPIWVYRLVSAAGATLSVLGTAWLGARLFGASAGLMAGIATASMFLIGFEGRIAKTDATLLSTVVFAQSALALIWLAAREKRQSGWAAPVVFWIATAAGILIKGPVTPFVSLLTILSLSAFFRDWRWLKRLRPLPGLVIVLAIVLPWLAAITIKSGGAFWSQSVGHDLLGKVGGGQESHGAPPGFYTLLFPLLVWPFGVFALRAGLATLGRWRADPRLAFLAAWYLPYWLLIEFVPTKLPHYVLPAYPAATLALAWAVHEGLALKPLAGGWRIWLERLTLAGSVIATLALCGLAIALPLWLTGHLPATGIAASVFAIAAGALASARLQVRAQTSVYGAAACSVVALGLLVTGVLPTISPLWTSRSLVQAFDEVKPCPGSVLASTGYEEPSLVFLAGTKTVLTDAAGAARHLADDPKCAVSAISDDRQAGFLAALPQGAASVTALGSVNGLNYSNGRRVHLTLYRMAQPSG